MTLTCFLLVLPSCGENWELLCVSVEKQKGKGREVSLLPETLGSEQNVEPAGHLKSPPTVLGSISLCPHSWSQFPAGFFSFFLWLPGVQHLFCPWGLCRNLYV